MSNFFSIDYMLSSFPILLSYVDVTIEVTIISILAGVFIGCSVALIRIHKIPVLNRICVIYVSFVRGTPFLVQLFLICFGLPQVLTAFGAGSVRSLPGLMFVFIVMSLHEGGYISEVMRGSILAIDKGQLEACKSVGMTTFQAYTRIIIPQAFRIAIPALSNNVISTLKSTSLIFNVGVVDMMSKADLMGTYSFRHLELYVDVGIIYLILCFIVYICTTILERKLKLQHLKTT